MRVFAYIVVAAFGMFLMGLAGLIVVRRDVAERFLRGFAGSPRGHYAEMAVRVVVGGALVIFAPSMRQPELFRLFGWMIGVSTLVLALMPWRWHQEFAGRVIPPVIRYIHLFAFGALGLGAIVLYGLFGLT